MKLNELVNHVGHVAKVFLHDHGTTIALVGGATCVGVSFVGGCKAATKAKDVATPHKEIISKIKEIHEDPEVSEEVYSEEDYKKELTTEYFKLGMDYVKLFGPSVVGLCLGLGSMIGSNVKLKQQNSRIAAAYITLDQMYRKYRDNVIEDFGERVDYNLSHGIRTIEVEEEVVDEKGKKKKVKAKKEVFDPDRLPHLSFTRFFDNSSREFVDGDADMNKRTLERIEYECNQLLKCEKTLWLNDVLRKLDLKLVDCGWEVGWRYDPRKGKQIDFGIYDLHDEAKRAFVNGTEDVILLDFRPLPLTNVPGVFAETEYGKSRRVIFEDLQTEFIEDVQKA